MKIYLPENLDLDTLIYNNPPNFKPFKKDKLRYIIHLLNAIPLMKKDLLFEGFIPLNATMLQKKIQNYKDYIDYLELDLKIIEVDKQYIVGQRSKGYRLVKKYQTEVTAVQLTEFAFRKTLKYHRNRIKDSVKHLNYLTKWFNEKLQIDMEFVSAFLKEEYKIKENNELLWDTKKMLKNGKPIIKRKKPIDQLNHSKISAEKIFRQEYYLMHDNNVYRFHSNLTNMRSIIRNAITYNGEKLISIDIKNCQPYLSTILLSRSFWIEQKNEPKNNKSLSISFEKQQSLTFYGFKDINDNNYKYLNNINDRLHISHIKIHKNDSYIMLGEIDKTLMNNEFNHYINLVVNGTLYEYLEEQFALHLGETFSNRKEVKTAVFQVLFTDNRFFGQEDARPKKLFQKLFPEVYEVFKQIKKKDKSLLPRLLQSIESYLIIDVIAKRIATEYPNAPIITIHDSVATTKEYVDVVQNIMEEELSKAIGHAPKLAREVWCKSNMSMYLESLNEKSKVVA